MDILQGVHHPRVKYPGQENKDDNKSDEGDAPEEGDTESGNQTPPVDGKKPRSEIKPELDPDRPTTSIRSALTSHEETKPSRLVRRE